MEERIQNKAIYRWLITAGRAYIVVSAALCNYSIITQLSPRSSPVRRTAWSLYLPPLCDTLYGMEVSLLRHLFYVQQ